MLKKYFLTFKKVLNCINFQKNSQKETQDICGHFYAFGVILFPDYQLISAILVTSSRAVIKL